MSEPVRFLFGEAIRASVKDVMDASSPPLDIAVAYWSEGGLPQLTSPQWNKETRIICDLMSGFCKPALIRTLRANQRIHVKKLHNLHAKVYLGTTKMVIGSANASGAGLDATTQSKQEAAVLVTEGAALLQAHDWFQRMWAGHAEDITEPDLTKAEAIEQAAKQGAKAVHDLQPQPPPPDDDQQFWNILTDPAYEAVMQFARNKTDAVQVKFGKLGLRGMQPNFTLIYSNAPKRRSFHFPGANGVATEDPREWDDKHLTRPLDVKRLGSG